MKPIHITCALVDGVGRVPAALDRLAVPVRTVRVDGVPWELTVDWRGVAIRFRRVPPVLVELAVPPVHLLADVTRGLGSTGPKVHQLAVPLLLRQHSLSVSFCQSDDWMVIPQTFWVSLSTVHARRMHATLALANH